MQQDSLYREIILDHWKHPHHYGVLKNASVVIQENNPLCGDEITLFIKLHKNSIRAITFTSDGCAISKAAASMLTDLVKGKTVSDIKALQKDDFLKIIGIMLTPARLTCALLAYSSLQKAL